MRKSWVFAFLAVLCAATALAALVLRPQPVMVSKEPPTFAPTPRGTSTVLRQMQKEMEQKRAELQAVSNEATKLEIQRRIDELDKASRVLSALPPETDKEKVTTTSEMMSIVANAFSVVTGGLSLLFAWLAYKVQARPLHRLEAPTPE